MSEDIMKYEILLDGTIKLTSDPISGPNHMSAEQFFRTVGQLSGGEVTRVKRTDVHGHGHVHDHDHEHGHDHDKHKH
jgi:hypothetical protein